MNGDETDAVFRRVTEFIEIKTGYPAEAIQSKTTLLWDIGLDGDDAEAFFRDFAEEFEVSLDSFVFSRHFGGEGGCAPLIFSQFLIALIAKRAMRRAVEAELTPITIETLVEAVRLKKWPAK